MATCSSEARAWSWSCATAQIRNGTSSPAVALLILLSSGLRDLCRAAEGVRESRTLTLEGLDVFIGDLMLTVVGRSVLCGTCDTCGASRTTRAADVGDSTACLPCVRVMCAKDLFRASGTGAWELSLPRSAKAKVVPR